MPPTPLGIDDNIIKEGITMPLYVYDSLIVLIVVVLRLSFEINIWACKYLYCTLSPSNCLHPVPHLEYTWNTYYS